MQSLARERWFLLRLKSKYAGMLIHISVLRVYFIISFLIYFYIAGQSIAIRLSRRINVVSKQLKLKLETFNSKHPPAERITWESVTQLDADRLHTIPHSTKYQAVRLFHKAARANEEEFRVISEMRNTIQHYLSKLEVITAAILAIEQSGNVTTYHSGARSLLFTRKRQCEHDLTRLKSFANHGDFPELSHYLTECDECEDPDVDPELVPEEVGEESMLTLESGYQGCPETKTLDPDELSTVSASSDSADEEDFFYCSDEEWESCHGLPSQTAQQPPKPPLLHHSSIEPTPSFSYVNLTGPPSEQTDTVLGDQVADTNSKTPSSSSDEEELEVQHWRKEKLFREEYARSTMVGCTLNCCCYAQFTLRLLFRNHLN